MTTKKRSAKKPKKVDYNKDEGKPTAQTREQVREWNRKVKEVEEQAEAEKCEAGCDPVLHPVVGHDSDGVPLCLRCYVELHKQAVSQSKSGLSSKAAKTQEETPIPPAAKEKIREIVDEILSDAGPGYALGDLDEGLNVLSFDINTPSSMKLASTLENARAMTQATDEELMTAIIRNLSRIDPVDLSVQIIDQRDAVLGELRSKLYGDKKLG